MKRMKIFFIAMAIMFSLSTLMAGCGGSSGSSGGSGGSEPSAQSSPVSEVMGSVSDGPIKNAKVSLDVNNNGAYDEGEPFCMTNENGEYSIDYILASGTDYLMLAEGSVDFNTSDLTDNAGDGTHLTFMMFHVLTSIGKRNGDPVGATYRQDFTPLIFRSYLKRIADYITDPDLIAIINSPETDGTILFRNLIKDQSVNVYNASLSIQELNNDKDALSPKDWKNNIPIDNAELLTALQLGDVDMDFPGFGAYIDTQVPYRGLDLFSGLDIEDGIVDKADLNTNINNYLRLDIDPGNLPGLTNVDGSGVTVNNEQKTIEVAFDETDGTTKIADVTLTWTFFNNSVVRNYSKIYTGGANTGSVYRSTYTFSSGGTLINVVFEEEIEQRYESSSGYTESVSASYQGTAIYERNEDNRMKHLVLAKFEQNHTESNSVSNQINTVNGVVMLQEQSSTSTDCNLAFDGSYSLYVSPYGVVIGSAEVNDATCEMAVDANQTPYGINVLDADTVDFRAQQDYADFVILKNPAWIKGVWSGSFTDSCSANNGQLAMTVTDTTASWWGQSNDMTRNYGTSVEINDETMRLMDNESSWSIGVNANGASISGNWSSGSCNGTFILNKI